MSVVAVQDPVAGSYRAALERLTAPFSPPATSTCPVVGRSVAV
jgi:hypothetical protein